uniref:UPAR/Ly6 domain-containing protein n=1 Tax=Scophthalmus maximus TaxID=52904 RepID=A0A8D3E4K3_SCOMX
MKLESLNCNKCKFGLVGVCLNSDSETCTSNTSVCFTGRATFSSLSDFVGFNTQGCRDNSTGCNATVSSTLLGVSYDTRVECCSTDNCNPTTVSAGSVQISVIAALCCAVLASSLGGTWEL